MKIFKVADKTVQDKVKEYFANPMNGLGKYRVITVVKKSDYDEPLYCVIARSRITTFTAWTCWNDGTQVLNSGHYALPTLADAFAVICEYADGTSSKNINKDLFLSGSISLDYSKKIKADYIICDSKDCNTILFLRKVKV